MTVRAGLLNDPVIHDDGCVGEVVSAQGFITDNGIPISSVDEDVDGHKGSDHPTSCKITTGSSVAFINGKPMAMHGSRVSCAGYVDASAQVVFTE